jgi:hypothetical protein
MAIIDTIADRSTGTTVAGKAYFETSTNKFIVYNGSAWIELDSDGTGAVAFENRWGASFDGSNDYLDCGGNANFSFTDGAGNDSAFSVSTWVKLNSNVKARVAAKGNLEWLFGTSSSNKLILYLWSNDSTAGWIAQQETTTLATGAWHHIVATYDGSNNASGIKLYRAGSLVTMSNASTGSYAGMASQQGSLRIGQWEYPPGSVMNGLVDEVAVFDYELSSSQVSDMYIGAVPGSLTSLTPLGWWRMGDNSNDSPVDGQPITGITDSSGNGNDAATNATSQPTFSDLTGETIYV